MTLLGPEKARQRRTGEELRRVMLDAARELFAENGYADTKTRDVARIARVSEQSVFSHFETKQGLYEAAVLEPFDVFVRRFTIDWRDAVDEIDSLEEMMTRYVEGLYGLVRDNLKLFRALPAGHLGQMATRGVFDEVERWVTPLIEQRSYDFDPAIAVRSVFVLVTTMALLQDELGLDRPRTQITRDITDTLLHGLTRRRGLTRCE